MDPITHAALGASCAQGILGKYNKNIPWQVGACAAMAPDLDIFIRFSNNPLSFEFWHRNFTHSLFFIPIGGLLVALMFMCFKIYRIDWKITLGAALIGYSTHALLDAFTAYGTVLLWPWSDTRVSWDIISIVNPLFTIPLILCVAVAVIYQKPKMAFLGLSFAAVLLLYKAIHHQQVIIEVQEFAKRNKLQLSKIRALPDVSSSRWRIIAKNKECMLIANARSSFLHRGNISLLTEVPLYSKNLGQNFNASEQKNLELFSWFSDGYVVVAHDNPLTLADGRYTMGNKPIYSLWGLKFLPKEKHLISLSYILLNKSCYD
jgi:inner membrane protein